MRILVEVYDADGVRTGVIEHVTQAGVVRKLGGVGSVTAEFPGTDEKALTLLTHEARVRIQVEQDGTMREVGRGIVRKPATSDSVSGSTFKIDCPDEMAELKDAVILPGYVFGNGTPVGVGSVVTDIMSSVSGWTVSLEAGDPTDKLASGRVDGASVLKALQTLMDTYGFHIRQSVGSKTLEWGAFQQPSGIRLINVAHGHIGLQKNDDVMLIDSIRVTEDSEKLVNRIYGYGSGEGTAAINLANAQPASLPYAIQQETGPDGRTVYYIETGDRPVRSEIRKYKITPVSNSEAAKREADNALYDGMVVDLDRSSQAQVVYSISVSKVRQALKPGDTVRVVFKGRVINDKGLFTYRDIDDDFVVLKVRETYSTSGVRTVIDVSNIDRHPENISEVLMGAVSDVKASAFEVKGFPAVFNDSETLQIQAGSTTIPNQSNTIVPAVFRIPISDLIMEIVSVKIRVRSLDAESPLQMRSRTPDGSITGIMGQYLNQYDLMFQPVNSGYYPEDITISINGVDRTSALGGPWGTYNTAIDEELDITEYIVGASGGIYQDHEIEFNCGTATSSWAASVSQSGAFSSVWTPSVSKSNSAGRIKMSSQVLAIAQGVLPT